MIFNGDADPEPLLYAIEKLARHEIAEVVAIVSDPRGPDATVLLIDALRAIAPTLTIKVTVRAKTDRGPIEQVLVRQAIQECGATGVLCGTTSTADDFSGAESPRGAPAVSVEDPDWSTTIANVLALPHDSVASVPNRDTSRKDKLRLAFVTPWKPQRTGIARHALVMEQALRHHYDVTVVTKQANDRTSGVTFMKPKAFREAADSFDRVLYQMGNSPFHEFILPMLTSIPGVVVMHDGQFTEWFKGTRGTDSTEFSSLAYGEGGLQGWLDRDATGVDLVRSSLGLIVHSWVGSARLLTAPSAFPMDFLRSAPLAYNPVGSLPNRAEARRTLGLSPTDVLVATFGRVHPTKRTLDFMQSATAAARSTSNPKSVRIAAVGQSAHRDYFEELNDFVDSVGDELDITLTGALDATNFANWVASADIAVQLRSEDHGESSAALIEAMASPAAVIVEDTGSMSEILDGTGIVLASSELANLQLTISDLIGDPERRQSLGQDSAALEAERHSPRNAAESYCQAIEEHYRLRDPADAIQALSSLDATEKTLINAANRLAISRNDRAADRLVLDVSEIASSSPVTGIQRVQEKLSSELVPAWNGRFLHGVTRGRGLHEVTQVAARNVKDPPVAPTGLGRLRAKPGDWLFSARYFPDALSWEAQANAWRSQGGRVAHLLYDLFPLTNPEWFPEHAVEYFPKYLATVLETSDTILTISESTLSTLTTFLNESPVQPRRDIALSSIRLGSDFGDLREVPNRHGTGSQYRALMVGTIEPRKGYADALAAFRLLDNLRSEFRLTIVGRKGWGTEELFDLVSAASRSANNVEWLDDCSDVELSQLYEDSDLLIAASHAEGFGLPLLEAARLGLPVLARDIGVFREVMGDSAEYFAQSATPSALAEAIIEVFDRGAQGQQSAPTITEWSTTAKQVGEALSGNRVHAQWTPESGVTWL